jgi:hypothetical protein
MWVHQITLLEVGCCVMKVEDHFHDAARVRPSQMFVEGALKTPVEGDWMRHPHFPLLGPQTLEVLRYLKTPSGVYI